MVARATVAGETGGVGRPKNSLSVNVSDKLLDGGERPKKDTRKEVADYFGKTHGDVTRAIEAAHCSPQFRVSNFANREVIQRHATGASKTKFVDMTIDGFTLIVMGFTGTKAGAFKERYIAAFNAMSARLRKHPAIAFDPTDPHSMRQYLLSYSEKIIELQTEKAELVAANDSMTADVAAFKSIADADGLILQSDAAKALGVGPRWLGVWLRENGWFFYRGSKAIHVCDQSAINAGLVDSKMRPRLDEDGEEVWEPQAMITCKGLTVLSKKPDIIARANECRRKRAA